MKFLKSILPLLIIATLSSCDPHAYALQNLIMGLIGIGAVSWIVFFIVVAIIKKETPAIVITIIIMLILLALISGC